MFSRIYLPTQIRFLIGRERVTCHGSKLTNSLGRTKLTNSQGNNDTNFRLSRDQVVLLDTAANLWTIQGKANDFFAVFSSFELGGITKHLMTGPAGNSEFCFPKNLNVSRGEAQGKQNSLFPAEPVIECFIIPPNSKLEKTAKKSFALRWLAHKVTAVSRSTTWSRASRKFMLFPRELVSFNPRHVTRFHPIGKRIWVGRYNKGLWLASGLSKV